MPFLKIKLTLTDSFIGKYSRLIKDSVIPYQERALKDEIEGADKSHCIENFRIAAKVLKEGKSPEDEFYGMVFQDSDVAKWLEGCAYSLSLYPDEELERRTDEIIDLIASAQHPDGYLNTYFTVKEPGRRWTNLQDAHELYCAGHMIEAAVAYAECTGKTKLLNVMIGMADNIYENFITNKAEGYPGHPEIELALMRLYNYTNNEKYLELARHFIDVRGVDSDYFMKEARNRGWKLWDGDGSNKVYAQNFAPVREQDEARGHAVRAVYLYTGMAMVAAQTDDSTLLDACNKLWRNIVDKKMYVTGAIGSVYEGESFSTNYHLPNDSAYAETCAAIGLIFFAKAMLNINKNSEYADVMEKALYNGVLSGMELDGTKFYYVNPLEAVPGISGCTPSHYHTLPQRPKWFTCACCPPNVARLLSSIGDYAYSYENSTLFAHLFIGADVETEHGKIICKTSYPYGNTAEYTFAPDNSEMNITLAVRLPAWSENTKLVLNGKPCDCIVKNGYAYISGSFTSEDKLEVIFDMKARRVFANSAVNADNGKVAFTRGPLVYCAEGVDNADDVLSLIALQNGGISEEKSDELGGVIKLAVDGIRVKTAPSLYSFERPTEEKAEIKLIPYYAWANRGLTQMRVWIPER